MTTTNQNLIGKFIVFGVNTGLIFKTTSTRVYYVDFSGCDRWVTIEDLNNRTVWGSTEKFYTIQDTPRDTFWWTDEVIERRKKEKNI